MFAAILAVGTAGLGCRGLLGIDDEGVLLSSGDDAGRASEAGDRPDSSLGVDASLVDGGEDAGLTAVDRRFAQWPLPPPAPLLSQYDLTLDTVTDRTTSLVWQRNEPSPVSASYPAAMAFCDGLTLAGQTDWRLPTRMELLTILDYGRAEAGFLNNTVFPDGRSAGGTIAWTASLSLLHARLDERISLDLFTSAVATTLVAQSSLLVRCLRGGPATSPVNRYLVASGTARDVRTGLVWQVVPSATPASLAVAQAACAELKLGAFASGWRLPTIRELVSLIDESREQAPLLPPIFSAGPAAKTWSSTERHNPRTANFVVDFATADITPEEFATPALAARCVH